jgi:hypothetical protein
MEKRGWIATFYRLTAAEKNRLRSSIPAGSSLPAQWHPR